MDVWWTHGILARFLCNTHNGRASINWPWNWNGRHRYTIWKTASIRRRQGYFHAHSVVHTTMFEQQKKVIWHTVAFELGIPYSRNLDIILRDLGKRNFQFVIKYKLLQGVLHQLRSFAKWRMVWIKVLIVLFAIYGMTFSEIFPFQPLWNIRNAKEFP